MADFTDLLVSLFGLAISLGIAIPLAGVLVRFRANYNPKALRLDAEGQAQAYTGPVVETYFRMLARTYRIEGISGLYKGLMPSLISSLIFIVVVLGVLGSPHHSQYKSPDTGVLGLLFWSALSLFVSLPTTIITYRAITTPYRLPWLNARVGLRVLFSQTERRKPWILYATPGLLASQVLHLLIVVCLLGPLRRWLLPGNMSKGFVPAPLNLSVYIVIVVLTIPVLAPLEVIATRLAIQRNHGTGNPDSEPPMDEDDAPEYYAESEDVIGLRNEEDPYLGMVHCFKCVLDEEGWRALSRGWWITLLGGLMTIVG